MTATPPAGRLRAGVLLALLAGLLAVTGLGGVSDDASAPAVATPQLQLTADTSQFVAGNIISDGLFFDGLAMSATDVQGFLDEKGAACVPASDGTPCLKSFRMNTVNLPADSYCAGYAGVGNETAASIIAKAGRSCGISQRVLMVILQKEQGLIRGSGAGLYPFRYTAAMGFGCPDTARCNPTYAGFQRQVYYAARQYKVYAANPGNYNYAAGRWNTIGYAPATESYDNINNARCGTAQVFIENQATAGLYIYTPYLPNAAALAAGYGAAPPCGAYGNRNFWLYYTDWFGSTQSPGGTAILARAKAAGTSLGDATSAVICGLRDGGCFRNHQKGTIYWSPATGAQIVRGAIGGHWGQLGWEGGRLGYPTREEQCGLRDGGCFQEFQRGAVYYAPAVGPHAVLGAIRTKWAQQVWERGPLGYPTTDEACGLAAGGCYQKFQGGSIYWSKATSAHIVSRADVLQAWGRQKWEAGVLGYPTGDTTCGLRDSGCYQKFQGGSVYLSATYGAQIVRGPVLDKWATRTWERGDLGYPTGDTTCGLRDAGCFQNFAGGAIYSSASTGAHLVSPGPVRDTWAAQKWERGALGYPTDDTACGLADTGCVQHFQGGAVYSSTSTGPHVVSGAVLTRWTAQGNEAGALGYPITEQTCGLVRSGCFQKFQNGSIYATPTTGARVVSGAFRDEWQAQRWERGALGYPVGERTCGLADSGCYQKFEGGSIYSYGSAGPFSVIGPIRDAWGGQRWERGDLGYPTANQVCGLAGGGCSQSFQGGSIYWSPTTGAHPIVGAIGGYWVGAGAQDGSLGYPTGNPGCGLTRGGCYQHFQNGSVYWTPAHVAYAVTGAIRTYWKGTGWERGTLGYPVTEAVPSGNQTTQQFEGGTLVLNTTTGQVTRR
ncbi:hypothetical protein [Geodermatophilus sp. URMC 64]